MFTDHVRGPSSEPVIATGAFNAIHWQRNSLPQDYAEATTSARPCYEVRAEQQSTQAISKIQNVSIIYVDS